MAPRKKEARRARRAVSDVPAQLAALAGMTVAQLRDRYSEVFGEETRSRNKDYLRKKVAWRIQELAEGGLSGRARDRLAELDGTPARRKQRGNGGIGPSKAASSGGCRASRDPRLPKPGTILTRVHDGVEHKVTVLDDGFELRGTRFSSLSKVAREITGTNWNGFLFFGLQSRSRKQNDGSRR